jgi:hypothetical protein
VLHDGIVEKHGDVLVVGNRMRGKEEVCQHNERALLREDIQESWGWRVVCFLLLSNTAGYEGGCGLSIYK